MADAIARREARRKRILENSENRLRIISGLTVVDDSRDVRFDGQACSSPLLKNDEPKEPPYQPDPLANSSIPTTSAPEISSNKLGTANLPSELENHSRSIDPSISVSQHMGSAQQQSEVQKSSVAILVAARLHLVGLAVIVRLLLSSNYGYFFGESIFAPLITVQLVKYLGTGSHSDGMRAGGGILNAALMLSGMPTRQISLLMKTLGTIKDFLEDFYIYFFAFIILHVLLELLAL